MAHLRVPSLLVLPTAAASPLIPVPRTNSSLSCRSPQEVKDSQQGIFCYNLRDENTSKRITINNNVSPLQDTMHVRDINGQLCIFTTRNLELKYHLLFQTGRERRHVLKRRTQLAVNVSPQLTRPIRWLAQLHHLSRQIFETEIQYVPLGLAVATRRGSTCRQPAQLQCHQPSAHDQRDRREG